MTNWALVCLGLLLSAGWTVVADQPELSDDSVADDEPAAPANATSKKGSRFFGMVDMFGNMVQQFVQPPQLQQVAPAPPPGQVIVIMDPTTTEPPKLGRTCVFNYCLDMPRLVKLTSQRTEECYCQAQRCECNPEATHAPLKIYDGAPQDQSEPPELASSCNPKLPCFPAPACPRAKYCKEKNDGYSMCICYATGSCSCWVEGVPDNERGRDEEEITEVIIGSVITSRGMVNPQKKKEEQRVEKVKRETLEIAAANMPKFNMSFVGKKR